MKTILVVGAPADFGRVAAQVCARRNLACKVVAPAALDPTDAAAVGRVFAVDEPWLVIDARGVVAPDDGDVGPSFERTLVDGGEQLARACARRCAHLVALSSNQVFDGARSAPYDERDTPAPVGAYGRAHVSLELALQRLCAATLIARVGPLFGLGGGGDFVSAMRRRFAAGDAVQVPVDRMVSPTYAPDLVHALLDLAIDGSTGVWHLVNPSAATWNELAARVAELAGDPRPGGDGDGDGASDVEARAHASHLAPAALRSHRGDLLPDLASALARHHADHLAEQEAT